MSHIEYRNGHATTFVGPDAVDVFRAASLAVSINLWVETGRTMTRGVGIRKLLVLAGNVTGKSYRASPASATRAVEDVRAWVAAAKAALPAVEV